MQLYQRGWKMNNINDISERVHRPSLPRVSLHGAKFLYPEQESNHPRARFPCLLVPTRQELVQSDGGGASAAAPRQLEDVQLFRGLSRVRSGRPVVARVSLADRSVEATAAVRRRRRRHACVELETVSSVSSHWLRGEIHRSYIPSLFCVLS